MLHRRVLTTLTKSSRIAIVRALQLGDVLCAVPAMRAIRQTLPDCELTLIGLPWARELVNRLPHVFDQFMEFPGCPGIPEVAYDEARTNAFLADIAARPFDVVVQMHGSGSFINEFLRQIPSRLHAGFVESAGVNDGAWISYPHHLPEVRRHLHLVEQLGATVTDEHLEIGLSDADDRELEALPEAAALTTRDYICLHPGARWPSRRWNAARFAAVGDALADDGWQIVLTGSAWERELVAAVTNQMRHSAINLAGRTTLGSMAALLHRARLVISNDTGAAHIAAAVRTPSIITVLGSDSARWAPLDRQRHRLVKAAIDCQPCEYFECPIGHPCATDLSVDAVLRAAHEQLAHWHPVQHTSSTLQEQPACAHSVC